jgi:three-Cys-motif partner protein
MATPNEVLWERKRHTAAKHQILTGYLDAWIPILAHAGFKDLVLIDGFAGPGRYKGNEPGSPLLMLDAYLRRDDRARLPARLHYFFIEEHKGRFDYLQGQLEKKTWPDKVAVTPIHGSFEEHFPTIVDDLERRFGSLPPTFAFIDPFGADQTKPELHDQLLRLPRCEALIYLPVTHLARFVREADLSQTLDNLYRGRAWEAACAHDDLASRKKILHDLFRQQLKESCRWVRSFEIVPEGGGNSYYLFFGTNNEQGLRKMKAAMWTIDPVGGQRFRDSTMVDHPVLFEDKPDFARLLHMLREHFGDREFGIEDACRYTLTGTPFRDDGHLKRDTLAPAEKDHHLRVTRPGGSKSGFKARTRLRFKPPDERGGQQ